MQGVVCLNQKDRLLFLKYAVPCATTLVQRKTISKKNFEELLENVKNGKTPSGEPEKIFKVAYAMCSSKALAKNKEIDAKTIRDYFWLGHDAVVDERFGLMRDFDPGHCKTFPGIVTQTNGEKAMVKTSLGKVECSTAFEKKAKKNDFVVVHRGYIVEKVGKKTALEIARKTKKFF